MFKAGDKVTHSISFSSYGKASRDKSPKQQHFDGTILELNESGITAKVEFVNSKGERRVKLCMMNSLKPRENN